MRAYKKNDRVHDRYDAGQRGTVTRDMKNHHNDGAWVAWDGGGISLRNPYTLLPFDHTTPCACSTCEEQGFIVTQGGEFIDRCDDCKVFASDEAALAAARNVTVSTDCPLRNDGAFRVDSKPWDPGVAIYFRRQGVAYVMACDEYETFAANLRALALTIEAIRSIERHGNATMMQQALGGFRELPAAAHRKAWWEVLGLPHIAGIQEIKRKHRALLLECHPDRTGDAEDSERAAELGRALLEARTDLGDIAEDR
jgi:hypothetical protein